MADNSRYLDNVCLWHPNFTGKEGKVFHEADRETMASLKARGWVDGPNKAGFFSDEGGRQTYQDFLDGKIPAIYEDQENVIAIAADQAAEAAALQAENEALQERIRQLESEAKLAKMNDEDFLDQKNDAGTLPKKIVDRGKPKATKKAA